MNNTEIDIVKDSLKAVKDAVSAHVKDANHGLDLLTDDLLSMVGGGDGVVCW